MTSYGRFDELEIIMLQDDKIAAQLEEVDYQIDDLMRLNEAVISDTEYLSESYEGIDYNVLDQIYESVNDQVDEEINDLCDANYIDDFEGELIDLIAEL